MIEKIKQAFVWIARTVKRLREIADKFERLVRALERIAEVLEDLLTRPATQTA